MNINGKKCEFYVYDFINEALSISENEEYVHNLKEKYNEMRNKLWIKEHNNYF
jgi:hypothetical protein